MKRSILPLTGLVIATSLSGCGLMEMSFKAGFLIALAIAALIGLLIWVFHFSYKLLSKYFPVIRVLDGFWDE